MRIRFVLGVAGVIALLIVIALAQEMNRRFEVQREVQMLEKEVQDMQRQAIELENLNQYFATEDYQERLARENLNYAAEGETVVLIPEEQSEAEVAASELAVAEDVPAIPLKWWNIFFVQNDALSG